MADWRDIGIGNYRAAVTLVEAKQYRSAVSRFYYAVFSIVTQELIERGAEPDFRAGHNTPSHQQVSALIEQYFTHFSEARRKNFIQTVARVYAARLDADYSQFRIDLTLARRAAQNADIVFRYLGVKHE